MKSGDINNARPKLSNARGEATRSEVLADGTTAWAWTIDPDGCGVAVARSAAAESESVLLQVRTLLEFGKRNLAVRELVVAVGVGGDRRFHERPDLLAVEAAVLAQPRWCSFVVFTEPSRMTRSPEAELLFLAFLREHNVELLFVDPPNELAVLTPADIAAQERAQMVARMRRASAHALTRSSIRR